MNIEQRTGRPRIPVEKQILAISWLLATPDCYRYNTTYYYDCINLESYYNILMINIKHVIVVDK